MTECKTNPKCHKMRKNWAMCIFILYMQVSCYSTISICFTYWHVKHDSVSEILVLCFESLDTDLQLQTSKSSLTSSPWFPHSLCDTFEHLRPALSCGRCWMSHVPYSLQRPAAENFRWLICSNIIDQCVTYTHRETRLYSQVQTQRL